MSTFRVNQRIKKVRGRNNVGATATIIALGLPTISAGPNYTTRVICDCVVCGTKGDLVPAGQPVRVILADWDPIIPSDPHIAADDEALLLDLNRFAELARERVT